MKIKFNDLYTLHRKIENDLIKVFKKNILNSNFIGGEDINKFEDNFKKINNSKYCISCANGSDALLIALKSLELKEGDEVITTAFSWIATSASITMAGGKVVFCDIEKDGYNIDPEEIKKKITKRTVGIIPVHLYGIPADMEKIMQIAKKNRLWVIEDCAQAHLSAINKKKVGNFGLFGTFSFYPGKNLGALGDAGCLVTNNKKLENKARHIANHGTKDKHLLEGINSRMDALQASFLNIKIRYLKKETSKRIDNANIYFRELHNNKMVILPKLKKNNFNTYHQFTIRIKNRNKLKLFLDKTGINTKIYYKKILPLLPAYKKLKLNIQNFKYAYAASRQVLSLPISSSSNPNEIQNISNKIKSFY